MFSLLSLWRGASVSGTWGPSSGSVLCHSAEHSGDFCHPHQVTMTSIEFRLNANDITGFASSNLMMTP